MNTSIKNHWGFVKASDLANFIIDSTNGEEPKIHLCFLAMGLSPTKIDDKTAVVVRVPTFSELKKFVAFDKEDGGIKIDVKVGNSNLTLHSVAGTREDTRFSPVVMSLSADFDLKQGPGSLYDENKDLIENMLTQESDNTYYMVESFIKSNVSFSSAQPAAHMAKIDGVKEYRTVFPGSIESSVIDTSKPVQLSELGSSGYVGMIKGWSRVKAQS